MDHPAGPLQLSSTPELSLRAGSYPSSRGIRPLTPLRRFTSGVHSQEPRPPSVEQRHLPDPVPRSRFLTALTASSTRVLRACCVPLPAMRFVVFPSRCRQVHPRVLLRDPRLPHDATHTLRRTPLVGSRPASPRPFPSCRYRSPRTPLRDRQPPGTEVPLGCLLGPLRSRSARASRARPVPRWPRSPALAGPVPTSPGRSLARVPRCAEASRERPLRSPERRSGCCRPIPPRRHRALAHRPPVRRGVQGSWSRVSGGRGPPGPLLAPDRSHRGGRWPAAAHSVRRRRRREHAPAPGGCGGTGVPAHPGVCFLALPRLRGREPRDLGRAALALCEAPRCRAASTCQSRSLLRDLAPSECVRIRRSAPARPTLASPEPWLGSDPEAGCSLRTPSRSTEVCLWAGLGFARRCAARFRDDAPARSAAEWPTSRPCSADESVATPLRCRWRIALSFHGLCSPPRSSFARSPTTRCLRRGCVPCAEAPRPTRCGDRIPPRFALTRARRTELGLPRHRSLSGQGAATAPPAPPRDSRAPVRLGDRCRRPSWGS
jgi:hypothetical protein